MLFSLQAQSYLNFWHEKFVKLFSNLLEKEFKAVESDFSLKPYDVRAYFQQSPGESESRSIEQDQSYKESLKVDLRITRNGKLYTLNVGKLPKPTSRGIFIIKGRERAVIAQFIKSPGLYLSVEQRDVRIGQNVVDATYYVADFRPVRGTWIRFELPLLDKSGVYDAKDLFKIDKADKLLGVILARKKRVLPLTLLRALGLGGEEIAGLFRSVDESILAKLETQERQFEKTAGHRLKADHICEALKLDRRSGDSAMKVRDRLLNENYFGPTGRWQINRRLGLVEGLQVETDAVETLTKRDLVGALVYLMKMAEGAQQLRPDDPYCLSNKQVRLLGDLLEEAIKPALIRALRSFRERIRGGTGEVSLDEDEIIYSLQQAINSNDKISRAVEDFFSLSPLSRIIPRNNALAAASLSTRITSFGNPSLGRKVMHYWPEGVSKQAGHVRVMRDLHWSHYGRVCPVDTPQGENAGVTLSLTRHSRVNKIGILQAPFRKIIPDGGRLKASEEVEYFSADQEAGLAMRDCWIAYADQLDAEDGRLWLKAGRVLAHCGNQHLVEVEAGKVKYVDAFADQPFSLAASLIPFLRHNDANRALMACNSIRQALSLEAPELPLVKTGQERHMAEITQGQYGSVVSQEIAFGKNLLTAFVPWKGLNFEDAIVISRSAAEKLAHVEIKEHPAVKVRYFPVYEEAQSPKGGKKKALMFPVYEEVTRDLVLKPERLEKLGEEGIVKLGVVVKGGDILVGKVLPRADKKLTLEDQLVAALFPDRSFSNTSAKVEHGCEGRVIEIRELHRDKTIRRVLGADGEVISNETPALNDLPCGVYKLIKITLERRRKLALGDKLANRHGGKGVISAILDDEQLPYLDDPASENKPDHRRHVEIILNPIGVISRLNLGQVYETHAGWIAHRRGSALLDRDFDLEAIKDSIAKDDLLDEYGKVKLFDPRSGQPLDSPVTVGYCYFMKLGHLAEDKLHARAMDARAYSLISQQPLKGKKLRGGQRLGEMEVWALQAHNASHLLQEMLTLKSDNPIKRKQLWRAQQSASTGRGVDYPSPDVPDMLETLAIFLKGIGLEIEAQDFRATPTPLIFRQRLLAPDELSAVRVRVATADDVLKWTSGEITEASTGLAEEGYNDKGLLSQPVFGPVEDFTCKCGQALLALVCSVCNVPHGTSDLRRKRLGHITLAFPVLNPLFLDQTALLLGISVKRLTALLHGYPQRRFSRSTDMFEFLATLMTGSQRFADKIAERTGIRLSQSSEISIKELLASFKRRDIEEEMDKCLQEVGGLDVVTDILESQDGRSLQSLGKTLVKRLAGSKHKTGQKLRQRLQVIQRFTSGGTEPGQLLLRHLTVIPPYLRPDFEADGQSLDSDLNHLYRQVISCNENLRQLIARRANQSALRNEKRRLQNAVDCLIDNQRSVKPELDPRGRRRKSLADYLRGKQGFFRNNLLGKRVDYSARAVIIPDPDLPFNYCGLPLEAATELFRPLLGREAVLEPDSGVELGAEGVSSEIKAAISKRQTGRTRQFSNRLAELSTHPVLVNRQPTLHRLGLQAFYWKITNHSAIAIHPLVTAGFNADFDGDTMALYRPVLPQAIEEARTILADRNIISPATGEITLNLGQDIALGVYYKTLTDQGQAALAEILSAGSEVDASGKAADGVRKSSLQRWMRDAYRSAVQSQTSYRDSFDSLMKAAFEWATQSGVTFSILDLPDLITKKRAILEDQRDKEQAFSQIKQMAVEELARLSDHSLSLIVRSGAKGDDDIINQIIGSRGEVEVAAEALGSGDTKTAFITSSLRDGMNLGEYFVSVYGARKSIVDKALGPAEAGYLTRKLVEVAHSISISEDDCCSGAGAVEPPSGVVISKDSEPNKARLEMRLYGRVPAKQITLSDGRAIAPRAPMDQPSATEVAEFLQREGVSVEVRSPITCGSEHGVCKHCYGYDLSAGAMAEIGTRVGIIAAQSIGEPGTQLVMRTFHTGGMKTGRRITQDLASANDFFNVGRSVSGLINGMVLHKEADSRARQIQDEPGLKEQVIALIKGLYNYHAEVDAKHFEIMIRQMLGFVEIEDAGESTFYSGQILHRNSFEQEKKRLMKNASAALPTARQRFLSLINAAFLSRSWLSAASFERGPEVLACAAISRQEDELRGLKERAIFGRALFVEGEIKS